MYGINSTSRCGAEFQLNCSVDDGRIDCEGVSGDIKEVSCIYDNRTAESDEDKDTCESHQLSAYYEN